AWDEELRTTHAAKDETEHAWLALSEELDAG
ncbi:MAG: hypothetical protein QOG52_713, partial [Frankiaceae bacterium]|nr:hypothetical protein [Frankiaceae bacterium]